MEYPTGDIAAARSLQLAPYIYTSITTIWWTFLIRSHWSKMKGLYIVTRYLPFIILAMDLYMSFTPNENSSECGVLQNINSGLSIVIVIFSECFFILRTYVLWDRNRIVLAVMLSNLLFFLIASFTIVFVVGIPAAYATSPIQGITGCYLSSTIFLYFIPFLLLSVFQLGLMILTLIRAIQNWRTNTSRLYVVLVNHNISYYACGLLFTVANIFTSGFQYSYHSVLYDFQLIVLAILATRMHLHLWRTNRHSHGSTSTLMHTPLSEISFANPMA
ncbi:hypothetical protein BDR06DRAFT_659121 [Suillus hirtellus]|nr:hypothetical protein BDR06DRAFT_659121 [Suillus hirtellus]